MNEELRKLIPSCFGLEDKRFAVHPSDYESAQKLIKKCVKESVELIDLLNGVDSWYREDVGYVKKTKVEQDFHNERIRAELIKVEDLYKKYSK